MNTFEEFISWEKASKDTIDFKKIYVDVAGDLIAGLLLSQIVYWHLPTKEGKSKLRICKKDRMWLAKQRGDWWEEIRITAKQYDRAITILEDRGIVTIWNTLFDGKKIPHISINGPELVEAINREIKNIGQANKENMAVFTYG